MLKTTELIRLHLDTVTEDPQDRKLQGFEKEKHNVFCRLNKYLQPWGRSLCADSSEVCCYGKDLDDIITVYRRGF